MEQAKFTCYHDLPKDSEVYVDEGYCDACPLSFCKNENKETKYEFCPHENRLYSK